jgi:hypothetical protein
VDELPEGMSFVSAYLHWCEGEEWCAFTPDISGQTLTWTLYPMGPNQWNQILLTVQIDSEIEEDNPLTNQASIASNDPLPDADPFPNNNDSTFVPELTFDAPAFTSRDHTTFLIGTESSFTFRTTGFPKPDITYARSLPGGLSFVDHGNGTATLSGTPEPGTAGNYELTLTACNGILPCDVQQFTLEIASDGFSTFLPLIIH